MSTDMETLLLNLESRLAEKISASEKKVMDHIDTKMQALETRIDNLDHLAGTNKTNISHNTIHIQAAKSLASEASTTAAHLKTEVDILSQNNSVLTQEVAELNKLTSELSVKLRVQEEKAENLSNRSLRKTISIRGIPEEEDEDSWDTTRSVATTALESATGIDAGEISDLIERIHRGGSKKHNNNRFPRKIFAAVYDWNTIDRLSKALRLYGKESGIYIDQQYGPETTFRRSKAFLHRRDLKAAGTIVSGYVKFPAQLVVKYGRDSKYVVCKDFSKIPYESDNDFKKTQ